MTSRNDHSRMTSGGAARSEEIAAATVEGSIPGDACSLSMCSAVRSRHLDEPAEAGLVAVAVVYERLQGSAAEGTARRHPPWAGPLPTSEPEEALGIAVGDLLSIGRAHWDGVEEGPSLLVGAEGIVDSEENAPRAHLEQGVQ